MTPSNKPRLYVALFARGNSGGGEPYHWALVLGPKDDVARSAGPTIGGEAIRYDVRSGFARTGAPWVYVRQSVQMGRDTNTMLGRVLVAKVTDWSRLDAVLNRVPVVQNDRRWNCRVWVRSALAALEADGKSLGVHQTDWAEIENMARLYVRGKIEENRYGGSVEYLPGSPPTYDMLEGREISA